MSGIIQEIFSLDQYAETVSRKARPITSSTAPPAPHVDILAVPVHESIFPSYDISHGGFDVRTGLGHASAGCDEGAFTTEAAQP